MTCNSIDSYKGFTVGKCLIIFRTPDCWSSALGGECPYDITFPKLSVIKEIAVCDGHIAMNDTDNFGYSLSHLIEENNITHDIKIIRKFKLQEICGKL